MTKRQYFSLLSQQPTPWIMASASKQNQHMTRMAPAGLMIDWNHDQQCLFVRESD